MFSSLYPLARAQLFRMDAEDAHHLTLRMLGAAGRTGLAGMLAERAPDSPRTVMGLSFRNPVGLAAGLDAYTPDVLIWDLGWDPTNALEQLADLRESKDRRATQLGRVEILMDDCISPGIQLVEHSSSLLVARVVSHNCWPKIHA